MAWEWENMVVARVSAVALLTRERVSAVALLTHEVTALPGEVTALTREVTAVSWENISVVVAAAVALPTRKLPAGWLAALRQRTTF